MASYHTESGNYATTRPYSATSGQVNAPLEALANGVDGFNGVYRATRPPPARSRPAFEATNYWVDVEFSYSAGPPRRTAAADSYSRHMRMARSSVPAAGVLANDTIPDAGTT